MKKYIILLAAAVFGLTACDSDYLETSPENYESTSVMVESAKNASLIINGMCRAMTTQYCSTQGFNGEGAIKTFYGNYPGQDCQKCNYTTRLDAINQTIHLNKTSIYNYFAWYYYYKQIANANSIICNIDNATGDENDKAFVKAQALTFRAYAFFMLSQIYCHRWSDEKGNCDGIVLRVDQSVGDQGLATLAETYEQIYADLDEAISLYQKSGQDRGSDEYYKPNIDVAYAVYARAALTREDWTNAAKYAALAKAKYSIMSNNEYNDGFHTANKEWIWGVYEAIDQTIYFYAFHAYQASNAATGQCRRYPLAISKELIDQIPETDMRRNLFLIPSAEELSACSDNGTAPSKSALYKRAKADYKARMDADSYVFAYQHFKFLIQYANGGPFPLIRAAEMYYIEAEADYHLNKIAEAQQLIYDANKLRDPSYTKSTKTGESLLDEIKLYRRFDLWGEGFDWYDCKRWGITLKRKSRAEGGSWMKAYAITLGPQDANQWTWIIPERETEYNGALKNKNTTSGEK